MSDELYFFLLPPSQAAFLVCTIERGNNIQPAEAFVEQNLQAKGGRHLSVVKDTDSPGQ